MDRSLTENKDQASRDDLNETEKIEDKLFMSISVSEIQNVDSIPDYTTASSCTYPIVVNESGRYKCIENWSLIEFAQKDNTETIECLVINPANPSSTDTAIRKVASRIKTEGGDASYAEVLLAIHSLREVLKDTQEELHVFSHGGRRRNEEFGKERENDLLTLLSNRLGKSRETIAKYMVYEKILNQKVLSRLAKGKVPKRFFEKVIGVMNKKAGELKSDGKTEREIRDTISGLVERRYKEWLKKLEKPATEIAPETGGNRNDIEPPVTVNDSADQSDENESAPQTHETTGESGGTGTERFTPEWKKIQGEWIHSSERVTACMESTPEDIDSAVLQLEEHMRRIEELRESLIKMKKNRK